MTEIAEDLSDYFRRQLERRVGGKAPYRTLRDSLAPRT